MRSYPILILAVGLPLAACDDPTGNPEPPSTGTLVVSITTEGEDPDPDGYLLTLDDADSLDLEPTGTAELELASGRHTLRLLDVAERCSVAPATTLEVDVPAGRTVPVVFEVTCNTGARVTVRTTGLDFDPNGYRVVVDGNDHGAITGFARLIGLDPGSRTIRLTDLAPNCAFDGPGSRTVTVVAAEVVPVEFAVVCTATSGVIGVEISGGSGLGFEVMLDGVTRFLVGPTGHGYWTGVPAGDHVVSLGGSPGCSVETGPQAVTVTAGTLVRDTVEVAFSVTCLSGFLITVPTTGPIPRSRYFVYVSLDRYYCDLPFAAFGSVAPNDTLVLQVETGTYCVGLGSVPRNCRVTEQDPPDPIRFVRGGVTIVEIKVACS
jgi:hypothetical protein